VTTQLATILFVAEQPAAVEKDTQQVRSILEALTHGKIDRALFTSNANSYFTEQTLTDIKKSLGAIGKLESVTRTSETLRGGMTHRNYRGVFQKKTVTLNIYVMRDGLFEQFMVVE
jgi:hypothetical protein